MGDTGKYKGITGTFLHCGGTSRGGRRPYGLCRQPQGHLGYRITEAAATVTSHAKALTAKLEQYDHGYNDRAEQVMVDVRYWHLADVDAYAEHVRFRRKADIPDSLANVR